MTAGSPAPAENHPVLAAWRALLAELRQHLQQRAAHPARCVVLLPYAQLMPLAARLWAAQFPDGFAPRFETTRNWAGRLGWFESGPQDLSFDHGRDLLTAAALLEGAGLGAQRALLAGPLLEQAVQLAGVAASVPPARRADWAAQASAVLPPAAHGPLALEAALGRIAIAWAAHSDYATDVLFTPRADAGLDALFIVPGLQHDQLCAALAGHHADKVVHLHPGPAACVGQLAWHACSDGEDEADAPPPACCATWRRAKPVALAAGTACSRAASALLAAQGVQPGVDLRDETGWKLSTTHAAARLLALLHACALGASTDAVLDALKLAPAFDPRAVSRLEQRLRRDAVRGWAQAALLTQHDALTVRLETLRSAMSGPRALWEWLAATRTLAEHGGLWPELAEDAAGQAVIDALGLADAGLAGWRDWPAAQRRMRLAEFTRWLSDTLEAASFRPPVPRQARVIILPLSQLLGRPLAALVLPGADEQRLPAAPEPPGPWSAVQRQLLQLPSREALQQGQLAAWRVALQLPWVDVLWRASDDSGEPLLPSPLVQAARLDGLGAPAVDPRGSRSLTAAPVARPMPVGAALPAQPISASGYEQLRACPYSFFALRQLALSSRASWMWTSTSATGAAGCMRCCMVSTKPCAPTRVPTGSG